MKPVEFHKFENGKYVDVYRKVNEISSKARKIWDDYHDEYHIEISQAVVWAIQGYRPSYIDERVNKVNTNQQDPEDILSYVSNNFIVSSVRFTLDQYIQMHRLEYYYHSSLNEGDRIRVRVLTNMILDHHTSLYYM